MDGQIAPKRTEKTCLASNTWVITTNSCIPAQLDGASDVFRQHSSPALLLNLRSTTVVRADAFAQASCAVATLR